MASLLDETAICNLALDRLMEAPIASFDDPDNHVGRWMRRNFWATVWMLLRRHPWNFAITRAQLATLSEKPAFGWGYAYQLPVDCLRPLPLTVDGTLNGRDIPHKIEGDRIVTNHAGPVLLRYVRRVENTGEFDTLFVEALVCTLASSAAHFITGKQGMVQTMADFARMALEEARGLNALEGTPEDPVADLWTDARL